MATINEVLSDNRKIQAEFPASTAISRGNLLYWDSSAKLAKNAAARTDLGTLALNQADFAPIFLGVMQDVRLSTETSTGSTRSAANALRVVVLDGVFDCPCTSQTWKIGDLVGVDRDGTNNVNFNQQVNKVTGHPQLSIGVVVQEENVATTVVRCRLTSRVAWSHEHLLTSGIGGYQGQGVTAGADGALTLTVDSNPIQTMTPTTDRVITLPAAAQSKGLVYYISNLATNMFYLNVKNVVPAFIGIVGPGETGIFFCDGTTWYGAAYGMDNAGGRRVPSNNIAAKTANYTVLTTDSGSVFTNAGAAGSVNFTLPAVANAKGFYCEIFGVVDQPIVVTAPAGTLVGPNNAGRATYTDAGAGNRIGVSRKVFCDGANYYLFVDLKGLTIGTYA